jgi:serine protease Do
MEKNMLKTFWMFILFFCCFVSTIPAQIRDYIVIVEPNFHASTEEVFVEISSFFEVQGVIELSDYFESFTERGYGSGFVFFDTEGNRFIITNRHVVNQAENVNITVFNEDGSATTHNNLPIEYIDLELDIAVISIPEEFQGFNEGLRLHEQDVLDGQTVWSAGYPSLLNNPSWQFARGIVTNQSVNIPQLIDPDISSVIQHSAPIDPGNSGGPLLISINSENTEFEVVGINTWKVYNRDSAYFALPAVQIESVVEKAKSKIRENESGEKLKEDLIKACKILASELQSDTTDWDSLYNYISYQFIGDAGWNSFLYVLETSDDEEEVNYWKDRLINGSPIETMRVAIFIQFAQEMMRSKGEKGRIEFQEINFSDESNWDTVNTVRTNFKINDEIKEIVWVYEFGYWRIQSTQLNSTGSKRLSTSQNYSTAQGDRKGTPIQNLIVPGSYQMMNGQEDVGRMYFGLGLTGAALFLGAPTLYSNELISAEFGQQMFFTGAILWLGSSVLSTIFAE